MKSTRGLASRRACVLGLVCFVLGCTRERERPIASDPTPTVTIAPPPVKPPPPTMPIVVRATVHQGPPPSAAIEIENVSDVDVMLEDRLGIEREEGGAWVNSPDLYDTVAPTCAGL